MAFLADPLSKEHITGPGHPEQPARFDAALRGLAGHALANVTPRAATEDEIALCHDRHYIDIVKRDVAVRHSELSTGDTNISPRSLEAALHATGTALNAVDLVLSGKASNAFCVMRPPGHHANANRGMGFCIFNNIAIAARYAQRKYGLDRVLIADWDVHHGNGTQDIFYSDPSVFFFSTHQYPWYPGTGTASERGSGAGEGATLNCPFAAGAGRKEILGAFREQLIPAAKRFQPDLVLISAGFDSRAGDPLGGFLLTDEDFAALTDIMLETGNGRLVSLLEGGYNLQGLALAVRAHAGRLTLPPEPNLTPSRRVPRIE